MKGLAQIMWQQQTWTNPGSSHSISYFFEVMGSVLPILPYIVCIQDLKFQHTGQTYRQKRKKKNDGHSDDEGGDGDDEEGDEENEKKKIALFRESL